MRKGAACPLPHRAARADGGRVWHRRRSARPGSPPFGSPFRSIFRHTDQTRQQSNGPGCRNKYTPNIQWVWPRHQIWRSASEAQIQISCGGTAQRFCADPAQPRVGGVAGRSPNRSFSLAEASCHSAPRSGSHPTYHHPVPMGFNTCLVYVYRGSATVGGHPVGEKQIAQLDANGRGLDGRKGGSVYLYSMLFCNRW